MIASHGAFGGPPCPAAGSQRANLVRCRLRGRRVGTCGIQPLCVRAVSTSANEPVRRPEHLVAARFEQRLVEDLVPPTGMVEISRAASTTMSDTRAAIDPALWGLRRRAGQGACGRFRIRAEVRRTNQLGGPVAGPSRTGSAEGPKFHFWAG